MTSQPVARHIIGLAIALSATVSAAQTTPDRVSELSLDSLLNTRISTASKYLQRSSDVAASVTILSADEIRHLGYSNVQELLESVPGMYVSNDRNYTYLGTRGFGRPADYNNRILVLVDGHTLNEQVWGSAPVGSDLPLNLNAIERVEVVRGPGSALYGTNAMFAVINIVTRTGTQLSGGSVHARIGSGMERQLGVTLGHDIGRQSSYAVSAMVSRTDGRTLLYPEFGSDPVTRGIARGLDWETSGSVYGSLIAGKTTTRAGFRTRSKGIPTGSYETVFGDDRAEMTDGAMWADFAFQTVLGSNFQLSTRGYFNRTTYEGALPYSASEVFVDWSNNSAFGGEAIVTWDVASRNRLTVGTEVRRIFRSDYYGGNAGEVATGSNVPFTVASVFAQNELELTPRLKLVGGLRLDERLNRSRALAPRFALVATPDPSTTLKALYGEAYRAPSAAEADIDGEFYTINRLLRPERIATVELVAERRLTSVLMVGVSAFQYSITNLIEQIVSDTTTGTRYGNLKPVRGRGLEASVNVQSANSPVSLRAWYALQKTRDDSTGGELSNSPNHLFNAALIARSVMGTNAALSVRHESSRMTLNGEPTSSFTRADLNLGYAPAASGALGWANGFEVSLRTTNLFNTRYAVPGGLEHVQHSIEQDGRTFSLRLRRSF